MGLPTDPYKWGDQKKSISEQMQGFDVKPNPSQPEDTTPPPGTPPNPEQIQTPPGGADDAFAPTYGEPRQKTPQELEQRPAEVVQQGLPQQGQNPDAVDPSLIPQQGQPPQQQSQQACPTCGQPMQAVMQARMSSGEYKKRFEESFHPIKAKSVKHGAGESVAEFASDQEAHEAAVLVESDPFYGNVSQKGSVVTAKWKDVDGHRLVNPSALSEFGATRMGEKENNLRKELDDLMDAYERDKLDADVLINWGKELVKKAAGTVLERHAKALLQNIQDKILEE